MVDAIQALSFAWAALALFAVAVVRSQCTYWLGRALRAGLLQSARWRGFFARDGMVRGQAAIERWGWPIIPLSFLTVGFQSAVVAGAGVLGWPWLRFSLASLPGCVLWGCVYAAGGLAAFAALAALASVSTWLALAALIVLLIVITLLIRRRRTMAAPASPPDLA